MNIFQWFSDSNPDHRHDLTSSKAVLRTPQKTQPLPSGKLSHNYGRSQFLMGKSTISMVIFHGHVSLPEGKWVMDGETNHFTGHPSFLHARGVTSTSSHRARFNADKVRIRFSGWENSEETSGNLLHSYWRCTIYRWFTWVYLLEMVIFYSFLYVYQRVKLYMFLYVWWTPSL